MEKDFLIQLTNDIYRLTLLFPKKEPLRYKIREAADDVLANLISNSIRNHRNDRDRISIILISKISVLDSLLEIAKNQNWVSPKEILKFQEEYDTILNKIKPFLAQKEQNIGPKIQPLKTKKISERQKNILKILSEKEKAQVWEFKKIFPQVTKRTLRRDFENLLNQGLVKRIGQRNETFYQVNLVDRTQ